MTNPPAEAESVVGGFDGWAVVDLASASLIRLNERGRELLELAADELPIPLVEILTKTDADLVMNQVFSTLAAAEQWYGGLRLGGRSTSDAVDLAPSPVLFVPHLETSIDTDPAPGFASLLFASNETAGAAAHVPDPLTGLATRSALFRRLDHAIRRSREHDQLIATFFVDLDGLKNINDRYGHDVGDTALIETAQRISACMPERGLVVRFGGDEFVILHESIIDVAHARRFAATIVAALNETGDYHAISASIGVSLCSGGDVEAQELIRRADIAMYQAKARGGSQVALFDDEMHRRQRHDESLRSSLLQAISSNGFGVAAQPIFELATGKVHGVELFIRLRDDAPYITSAHQLFRLAHEYGEAFDAAVLGRAMALAARWRAAFGAGAPRLQVNVSTQSLAAAAFARRVGEALSQHNVDAKAIAFEVDGQDLAIAGSRERQTIEALQDLGVPLVVDGFGHHALSLPQLAEWKPAMVKIAADGQPAAVTTGLVRAISALHIPMTVKGIGSLAEREHAVGVGAFCGQGNALVPVRRVEHIDRLLHGPQRLGF